MHSKYPTIISCEINISSYGKTSMHFICSEGEVKKQVKIKLTMKQYLYYICRLYLSMIYFYVHIIVK